MHSQATRQIPSIIGSNIRRARLSAGLTQHQLAGHAGTQAFQVSRWEKGLHRPKDETLAALAEVLGCDVAWFYTDHERTAA